MYNRLLSFAFLLSIMLVSGCTSVTNDNKATTEFTTYADHNNTITMQYPKNWTVGELIIPEHTEIFFLPPEGKNSSCKINLFTTSRPDWNFSIFYGFDFARSYLLHGYYECYRFNNYTGLYWINTTLGGRPAIQYAYTYEWGEPYKGLVTFTLADKNQTAIPRYSDTESHELLGNLIYVIEYRANSTMFDKYADGYQHIIESFNFTK